MRRKKAMALLLAAWGLSLLPFKAAQAAAIDCPFRDAPFSQALPIVDILLSPQAKAVLERDVPDLFKALPPRFFTTQAPTFAAILTLDEMVASGRVPADQVARADAALRRLPVTAQDGQVRCARYDDDRPTFTLPAGRPRLLLFEKMTGFRDGPSVEAARSAFVDLAARRGWAIAVTDKGGAMNAQTLRQFDAVIWNNVSGDVLTLSQRQAFRDYIEQGGGFVGVHGSSGDPATFWPWYADTLIGARFAGHPMNPQFQDGRIMIEDGSHPVAQGLPDQWIMKDEWYSFRATPRATGARIVATLDEKSYQPGAALIMGDHPIAWSRCVGKGRVFYSAIGHRPETYTDPRYSRMLDNALAWVAAPRRKGPRCD